MKPNAPDASLRRAISPAQGLTGLTGLFLLLFGVGYVGKALLVWSDPERNATFAQFTQYRISSFTAILIAIGLASAFVGALLPRFHVGTQAIVRREARPRVVWTGLAAGGLAFLLLVRAAGISPAALRPFDATSRNILLEQYIGRGHLGLAISICPLFLLLLPQDRDHRWHRRAATVMMLLTFTLLGSRLFLLGTVFALALFQVRRKGQALTIGRQIGLVLLVGAAGATFGALIFKSEAQISGPYDLVVRGMATFDMADTLAVVEALPDRLVGQSAIEDATITYVPRAVWASKPVFYGAYRLQETAFPGIGKQFELRAFFPVGLLGESWVNFGLLGVAVIPFLVVRGLLALDRWSELAPTNLAFTCFIAGQLLNLLRSPGQFLAYLAVSALVFAMATRRVRPPLETAHLAADRTASNVARVMAPTP